MIQFPKMGLSGHYKVGVIRANGAYEQMAEFGNLITDAGLDAMAANTTATLTQYCRAGTGTTPPANGQTTLVSPLGSASGLGTSVVTTSGGTPVWFQTMTRVYTFAIGAVVGNVAELGIFNATSGGIMFSRALVKDGGGNPTTITVLADEQLVVTYALRIYPPAADVTGTFSATINGVPTQIDYAIRPANVSLNTIWGASTGPLMAVSPGLERAYESQALGAVTGEPAGTPSSASGAVGSSYVAGSFFRDVTLTFSTAAANFASGVGAISFAVAPVGDIRAGFQMSFTPKIPKDDLETLTITYRISWGRYVA